VGLFFFEANPAFPPSPLFRSRFLMALRSASAGRRRKALKNRRSKCGLSVQSGLEKTSLIKTLPNVLFSYKSVNMNNTTFRTS
jgi:hypothetical protein